MIKKIMIFSVLAMGVLSCSSYTEEQTKAAVDFCECMEKETVGNFDIDFYECDIIVKDNYNGEVFADEGYSLALDEKCPDISAKITE